MYPFGQDITYKFTPLLENETVAGIPSHTATLYVFDQQPSPTQVLTGSGADFGPYSGSWAQGSTSCSFTITAIQDVDQSNALPTKSYWVGVKFKLKSGGQDQYSIRELILSRVVGHDKELEVKASDLIAIYSSVSTYADTNKITANITLAKSWLKRKLKNKGFEYQLVHNLEDLRMVVSYRALAQIMLSQIKGSGSQFETLYEGFNTTAKELLESLDIEYDSDSSGTIDQSTSMPTFSIVPR